MKLSLAGSTLFDASAGLPPVDLRINGVRVVELVDFARATSKGVFFRGNSGSTITFSTSRVFASYADAQDAFWLAEALAPTQGPLLIRQTGAAADRPPVGAANAMLASVVPTLLGVRVDVAYTIQAGRLTGGAALPYLLDPEASQIMIGAALIPAGQSFVAVNFPAPLNDPQVVVGAIVAPAPGMDVPAVLAVESLTNAGFVARLSAPVPTAGFSLAYSARAGS